MTKAEFYTYFPDKDHFLDFYLLVRNYAITPLDGPTQIIPTDAQTDVYSAMQKHRYVQLLGSRQTGRSQLLATFMTYFLEYNEDEELNEMWFVCPNMSMMENMANNITFKLNSLEVTYEKGFANRKELRVGNNLIRFLITDNCQFRGLNNDRLKTLICETDGSEMDSDFYLGSLTYAVLSSKHAGLVLSGAIPYSSNMPQIPFIIRTLHWSGSQLPTESGEWSANMIKMLGRTRFEEEMDTMKVVQHPKPKEAPPQFLQY